MPVMYIQDFDKSEYAQHIRCLYKVPLGADVIEEINEL